MLTDGPKSAARWSVKYKCFLENFQLAVTSVLHIPGQADNFYRDCF